MDVGKKNIKNDWICVKWLMRNRVVYVARSIYDLIDDISNIRINGLFDIVKLSNKDGIAEKLDNWEKEIRILSNESMALMEMKGEQEELERVIRMGIQMFICQIDFWKIVKL